MQRNEDLLLGKLAVRQGLCSQEQVDECLRIQSQAKSPTPLGDLLLFKGYLTSAQVQALLARQHKKVMRCPACRLSFTVLTTSNRKSIDCPRCKGPLAEAPAGPLKTDAEFATRAIRRPPPPAPKAPAADVLHGLQCIICDHAFDAAPDPSGRVQCPSCRTTFSPESK